MQCLVGIARAEELESGLRVEYDPPQLSVNAREVSLGAVLRAIGAKVGFSVVETAPASKFVTLSIRNASLDDVLRRLLRAENHTVLYRTGGDLSAESDAIDRIVLSGEPSTGTAAAPAPEGSTRELQQAQNHRDAGVKTASLPVPSSPQSGPESTPLLDPAQVDTSDPAASPITVADILKARAMAAAQAAQLPDDGSIARAGPLPDSSLPPANLDAALAETTRRAQQALGALIEGLAAATRSLQQSVSTGGK